MVSWKKAFLFFPSLSLIKALPFSRYPPFGKGLRNYKAVRTKILSAFFNKSIEIIIKVCYTIMAFEENKHPRDKDGKFTTKGNQGDKEYRQNTDYKQILEDKYNSELPGKPVEAFGFANKERLNTKDHVQHAKDMGFKNQKEYERFACEFWNTKRGKLYYSNRRKRYYRYEEKTNLLCVSSNGIIHTFMKKTKKEFEKTIKVDKLDG